MLGEHRKIIEKRLAAFGKKNYNTIEKKRLKVVTIKGKEKRNVSLF